MRFGIASALAATALLGAAPVYAVPPPAVTGAEHAMGVEALNSIHVYGAGATYQLGQNNNAEGPWPRINLNDYNQWIDFTRPAERATAVTWTPPNSGGAAVQGAFNQQAAPTNLSWGQHLEIWTTPWGFLKGAAQYPATVTPQTIGGVAYRVVSWSPPQKAPSGKPYRVVGYIGPDNLVRKVETWVESPLFGDMKVETSFANYREINGVKFPTTVQQRRGGWPSQEVQILGIEPNPTDIAQRTAPPAAPQPAAAPPAAQAAASEQLAPGVWRIKGAYQALAVEFQDYALIFEPGPQNEDRARAIIAETHRVIPGKPIRYGVISHHHLDHTSGLSAVVAEGITIVAHQSSRPFLERALNAPRTLAPDAVAKSGRKPVFESIGDKRVFQDASHSFEVHMIKGVSHADGLMMGYLPKEKILIFADVYTPPTAAEPAPKPQIERTRVFLDNIERLGLQPERIISVHPFTPDRPATLPEIRASLGR